VGAIIRQELTRLARRQSHYAMRAVLALITLYVGGAIAFLGSSAVARPGGPALADLLRFGPEIAERAVLELTWVQMLAILLIVPGLAAGSIAEDDRRGTMSDLLATPLTGGAIVLGKMAGPLVYAAIVLLVGLPLVTPALFVGLIARLLVARAWFMLAVLAIFVASLSLLAAAVVPRPRNAVPMAYCLVGAWILLPIWLTPVVRGLAGPWAWVSTIDQWMLLSHPSEAALGISIPWTRLYGDPSTKIGWVWLGLSRLYVEPSGRGLIWGALPRTLIRVVVPQSLAAVSCLVVAALSLRARRLGLRGRGPFWLAEGRWHRVPEATSRPVVGDDPMLWKETNATGLRGQRAVRLGIALLFGTMLIPLLEPIGQAVTEWIASWAANAASDWRRSQLNESLRSISTALYLVELVVIGSVAAASVADERERGSWTALVTSPLTGWEIARAKVRGVLWGLRWLALPFGTFCVIGLATGSVHALGFLAAGLSLIVFAAYAASLGVLCSMLSATSDRALLATLMVLMVSNAFPLLFVPLDLVGRLAGSREALFLAGVTPFVQWISLVSPIEIQAASNGWVKEGAIRLPFIFWTIRVPLEAGLLRLYGTSMLVHLLGALVATRAAAWAFEASRGHRSHLPYAHRNRRRAVQGTNLGIQNGASETSTSR
jgi:ABC-type transport system involved in multi-copper enzyme maturation permease subunit